MRQPEWPNEFDSRHITVPQLRELVQKGGLPYIADAVRQALTGQLDRPMRGWPSRHLWQSRDACQTVALANGVRCYQAAEGQPLWSPDEDVVEAIRRAVTILGKNRYSVVDVAETLKLRAITGKPLVRDIQLTEHPVEAAEVMADNGFAVLVDGDSWTATTVVPNLARLASAHTVPEFIEIEPYQGSQVGLTAGGFCAILLRQNANKGDATVICTTA